MEREKWIASHPKSYTFLIKEFQTSAALLDNSFTLLQKSEKLFKNGTLKRKSKELRKQQELRKFIIMLSIRHDKSYKLLCKVNGVDPEEGRQEVKMEDIVERDA